MTTHPVTVATAADDAAIYATLTLAFSGDPPVRWTWPEPGVYIDVFPRVAQTSGGAAFKEGTAHRIGSAGTARPAMRPLSAALPMAVRRRGFA